jgi:hypothetical protein|tara:strand:+ start:606 stop:785 length:180 start_codon:yes stop_codon:yes gene_type:complete
MKELIIEKDYNYYYKDHSDGATYKVCGYFIADITFKICRIPFDKCDFSKRVEVDWETLN